MKRTDADYHLNNLFQPGNPLTGQRGTRLDHTWLNAVQEELAYVIETAEIELDPNDNGQMLRAIRILSTPNYPVIAIAVNGASILPTEADVIRVRGHTVEGRGGANYKRIDAEPPHAGKFQDASGQWWELNEYRVTPQMFGAVADGFVDDAPSIEAMMQVAKDGVRLCEFPQGAYRVSSTITIANGVDVLASSGAVVQAGADNMTVFKTLEGTFSSSIKIERLTVSGGGYANVTAYDLDIVGQNSTITDCYVTTCARGWVLERAVGLRLVRPTTRNVPEAIVANITTSAVVVDHPNFDNKTEIGGSGTGVGINVTDTSVIDIRGGYIQGYTHAVRATSVVNIENVYFESCSDAAVFLDGARGAIVKDCYHFAYGGTSMVKGSNARQCQLLGNRQNKSTATTGLYDFDASNEDCYEWHAPSDSVLNTATGNTTGLRPIGVPSRSGEMSASGTGNAGVATAIFEIIPGDLSVTRCEVTVQAIERTAYSGHAIRKFTFSIHRSGSTTEVSAVAELVDYALSRSNVNYEITPSVSTTSSGGTITISLTLTAGGAIGFNVADYTAQLRTDSTSVYTNIKGLKN